MRRHRLPGRKRSPYNLERGEVPITMVAGDDGTFLLTSRRAYRLAMIGECQPDKSWVTRVVFQPCEVEPIKTRKVKND